MVTTLDSLSQDALVLPPDQRMTLAYRLLSSVEPTPAADVESAWEDEILKRMVSYDSGESQTVSAATVFARLREIAPGQ